MTEINRQMTLFDILDEMPVVTNKLGKSVVKGVVEVGNVNPPDVLMELSGTGTLEQFTVSAAKLKGIKDEEPLFRIPAGWRSNVYAAAVRNRLIVSDRRPRNSASCLELPSSQKDLNTTLIYVDQNGVPWSNRITMYFNKPLYISYQSARDYADGRSVDFEHPVMLEKMEFSKWKVFAKYPEPGSYMLLNSELDLWDILERTNPYGMETAKQYDCTNPLLFV